MPPLALLPLLLRCVATVTGRRLRRGPAQPNWSLPYEASVELMRHLVGGLHDPGVGKQRIQQAGDTEASGKRARFEADTLGGRPAEWNLPTGEESGARLLYLHGGGYASGSPRSHRPLTAGLARSAGARVLSLDYRLAPAHPCPAPIQDVLAAWSELLERGEDPARWVIGGDSAGGGLTVSSLVALREADLPLPAGALLLSPWTDLRDESPALDAPSDYISRRGLGHTARLAAGELPLSDPRLTVIHADLRGLPPIQIVTGGAETLLADSAQLEHALRAAGVEVALHLEPGECHVYPILAQLNPRARQAIREMGAWVRERTVG